MALPSSDLPFFASYTTQAQALQRGRESFEESFISEKTVARHLSNIFDKVGVSRRTGATAWAFHHNLI